MSLESNVHTAVLAVVLITTIGTAILTHRSPMGEPSLAMKIRDWWRSRYGGFGEREGDDV